MERIELEQKGFPVLFDIGNVISGISLRCDTVEQTQGGNRSRRCNCVAERHEAGLDFLRTDKEKVAAHIIKSNKFGDPATIRKVVNQFSTVYSVGITKEDIEALFVAAHIEAEAKKLGGAEKFFTRSL